ncbi:MAG: TaqI-like C-terminal specificity domain-containing protein [Ktedonobacteraceae bacterium]
MLTQRLDVENFSKFRNKQNISLGAVCCTTSGITAYLKPFEEAAQKRQDKGQFWWELRACDYYDAFEKPKIFWPDIAKFPRFSWDEKGQFVNNQGYILPTNDRSLLGILQSRVCWFCITRLCAPLGERIGLLIYRHFTQYITNLPIATLNEVQCATISKLAQQLTETANQRYQVRRKTAYRIQNDLGMPQARLNRRLEVWWELSFKEFRDELLKVFKRDIPLKDRDDWEGLLRERSNEIERLTKEIVRLETELNKAVYEAYGLNDEEIKLIEQETKYQYGEW